LASTSAPAWLARETERVEVVRAAAASRLAERDAWALAERSRLERLARLDAAITARTEGLARSAEADPPSWLIDQLGEAPEELSARSLWRRSAGLVLSYRERFDVTGDGIGRQPREPAARMEWWRVADDLERTARRLGRTIEPARHLGRGL